LASFNLGVFVVGVVDGSSETLTIEDERKLDDSEYGKWWYSQSD